MGIKTADRTLDLIELFAREQRPLSLSDLAGLLSMPVSSAHGLVKTLQARGYLYELGRRQGYYPTRKLTTLAQAINAATPLLDTLAPELEGLRDATGETVVLAKRQGPQLTYLEVVPSRHGVRFSPAVGEVKALHCTATGKALLGAMPQADRAAFIATLTLDARTPVTITDPTVLLADIERGAKRGWHAIVGENIPDLMSIGAPLRIGDEIYALGLGGPTPRFKPAMNDHARQLLLCCATLERLTR